MIDEERIADLAKYIYGVLTEKRSDSEKLQLLQQSKIKDSDIFLKALNEPISCEIDVSEISGNHNHFKVWCNMTPAMRLAIEGKMDACDILIKLVENNAKTLTWIAEGAACRGNIEYAYDLKNKGANIDDIAEGAARFGNVSFVNALIEEGANINSALMGAAHSQNVDLLFYLAQRYDKKDKIDDGQLWNFMIKIPPRALALYAIHNNAFDVIRNICQRRKDRGTDGDYSIEYITVLADMFSEEGYFQYKKILSEQFSLPPGEFHIRTTGSATRQQPLAPEISYIKELANAKCLLRVMDDCFGLKLGKDNPLLFSQDLDGLKEELVRLFATAKEDNYFDAKFLDPVLKKTMVSSFVESSLKIQLLALQTEGAELKEAAQTKVNDLLKKFGIAYTDFIGTQDIQKFCLTCGLDINNAIKDIKNEKSEDLYKYHTLKTVLVNFGFACLSLFVFYPIVIAIEYSQSGKFFTSVQTEAEEKLKSCLDDIKTAFEQLKSQSPESQQRNDGESGREEENIRHEDGSYAGGGAAAPGDPADAGGGAAIVNLSKK